VRLGVRLNGRFPNIRTTKAMGPTTRKNSTASMTGLTTFAIVVPSFNQSLLSMDKREGATIPSNNSRAPAAKIRHATGVTASATNDLAVPITMNTLPTVHPNARSPPASVGSTSR
jgi:hypothetical protein